VRRGLISWSREEVAASVLDDRVSRLQAAMRKAGLEAMIVYTSFARPSAVAWLTHFVPYWNEAILVVHPAGPPVLLAAFSKRVHDWIREVSHVGEVRAAPDLGRAVLKYFDEHPAAAGRIGVVELDALPWPVAAPLIDRHGVSLVDATSVFAGVRQPADEVEIRLARRASQIAAGAFAAIPAGIRRASQLLAALEGSARLGGAEDVQLRLAADLGSEATLRRVEGDAPLANRHAVQMLVTYKAACVRVTRSLCTGAAPRSWQAAAGWLVRAGARLGEDGLATGTADPAPGRISFWQLESSLGSQPLSAVAGSQGGVAPVLPAGSLASLSVRIDLDDGPWLGGGALQVGGRATDAWIAQESSE
jgi:hypothetical protein